MTSEYMYVYATYMYIHVQNIIKRRFFVRVFMQIVRVKHQLHKFVPYKFLSRHTLQFMKRSA